MRGYSLSQVLAIYTWFPLAVLLILNMLLARLYGRLSGRRTYYLLFIPILIFYALQSLASAASEPATSPLYGDLGGLAGGLLLLAVNTNLYLMMRQRNVQ